MSFDLLQRFAVFGCAVLAGCGASEPGWVYRDQRLPATVRVPGGPGLVYQVAAAPGGPNRCALVALADDGAVIGRDEGSGPLGLPQLSAPEGTRAVRLESLGPGAGRVHLYVNDPAGDRDGDGLGAELERALGTCDAADDPGCKHGRLAKYYARVEHGTRDADRDGLRDGDELFGVAGEPLLDLPRFGADPRHKDVFVEIDHSKSVEPPGISASDLIAIQAIFARGSARALRNPDGKPGIAVHFDAGFEPADPAYAGLFGDWGGSGQSRGDYKAARKENFSKARRRYFRYAVLARGGLGQSSGDALVINRDFNRVALLAHELAHTLGLKHEGHPSWGAHNCKPHHRSIINYVYQNEHEIGFSQAGGTSLNPASVLERTPIARALAEGLRKPPFELDASEQGIDWNRDGVLSDEPVRAGITWATYKSCMAGFAGKTELAETARAASPVAVAWGGAVHAFWIDPAGELMQRSAQPVERCGGQRCAALSRAAQIDGPGELAQLGALAVGGARIALAHVSSAGELGVSMLEARQGSFRIASRSAISGAVTQDAPALGRAGERALLLFRTFEGALMQASARTFEGPFQIAPALDGFGVPIATVVGPSLLELGTGELCGVFPDLDAHIRFYCYEPALDAWRDLTGSAFYAAIGPKTGGPVGMAYHRFRYADGGFVSVYLAFTEPAPDSKRPDNPSLLISRALDRDAPAARAIDFRWRGSLINQWAHVAQGTGVALVEDPSLPGLVAIMPARDKDAPSRARIDLLPVADGAFDAALGTGDDFAVMERGICTGLLGVKACGDARTGAY